MAKAVLSISPYRVKVKLEMATDAKKPGFYENSLVWKPEIYEETRFLASAFYFTLPS